MQMELRGCANSTFDPLFKDQAKQKWEEDY